jgi:hypothetical protein
MRDLSEHPLYPFFCAVADDYHSSIEKYGPWPNDKDYQTRAVKSECLEWEAANLATGKHQHREQEELIDMANVAGKRWLALKEGCE